MFSFTLLSLPYSQEISSVGYLRAWKLASILFLTIELRKERA